jgi:LysR family nitrogen assimilation transcriptional regulator
MPYNSVMGIDLKSLRYFSAVAAARSFSKAAGHLRIAQPALSLQVKRMEEELGVSLLVRTAKGVMLTSEGERFLRSTTEVLRHFQAACDDVKAGASEPVGNVALGLPQSMAKILTVPLVRETLERWPKIRLQVIEMNTGYVPGALNAGHIDLGMMFLADPVQGLQYRHLVDEQLVLVGPAGAFQPIANGRWQDVPTIPLRELTKLKLVLPTGMHSLRELIDGYAKRNRLNLNVIAEVNAIPQLIDLARAGVGYTILSYSSVKENLEQNIVSGMRISEPAIVRQVFLCRSADIPHTHAASVMEGTLIGIVQAMVKDGNWPAELSASLSKKVAGDRNHFGITPTAFQQKKGLR